MNINAWIKLGQTVYNILHFSCFFIISLSVGWAKSDNEIKWLTVTLCLSYSLLFPLVIVDHLPACQLFLKLNDFWLLYHYKLLNITLDRKFLSVKLFCLYVNFTDR